MVPNRQVLLTVGLVALLALSGCLGTGPLSEEQEQHVADEFEERFSDIDGFTATVHTEMSGENASSETRAEVWQRPGTGESRQEVLAPDERAGDVTVTNESTSIYYDESENSYTKMDLSGLQSVDQSDLGSQLRNLLDRFDVIYDGTATVEGQETHEVTLVPANESGIGSDIEMTMWVDADNWFPVKQRLTSDEGGFESTTRYENVTVNPGIDDERFTFEPPADATERDTGIDSYDSRADLAGATNATLPDPDLPEGFTFEGGTATSFNDTDSVSLRYASGDETLSISVTGGASDSQEGDQTVEVGNRTGHYSEMNDYGHLIWTCEDSTYSVAGEAGKETLVDVGASIECPA